MKKLGDFEEYFKPYVYERGMEIAAANVVSITKNTEKEIQGWVSGTQDYRVAIKRFGKELIAECDCPYAEAGEWCKHQAAVLIAADREENEFSQEFELPDQPARDYRLRKEMFVERMKDLDKEELTAFLSQQIRDNEKLRRAFMLRFMMDSIGVKAMTDTFKAIVFRYEGREGFIDYYKAGAFFSEIDAFMEDLRAFFGNGLTVETVQVLTEITLGFDELPMDDSGGWTRKFYEQVEEMVRAILEEEVPEATALLYEWMERVMQDPESWYLQEFISPYWRAQYSEAELADMKIRELEKKLDKERQREGDGVSYIQILMELVEEKEKRGDDEAAILKLLAPHWQDKRVIWYLIRKAQKYGDEKKEEALLLKGLAENADQLGVATEFRLGLCRLYQDRGEMKKYRKYLEELVINSSRDLSYYREYKKLFGAKQWPGIRSVLFEKIRARMQFANYLADLYVEEGMIFELYQWLEENPDLSRLKHYAKHLDSCYDERLLRLYLEALDQLSWHSGDLAHYQNIVEWMEHIQKIPGGKEAVLGKAAEYRTQYKRRKKFMAALDGLRDLAE